MSHRRVSSKSLALSLLLAFALLAGACGNDDDGGGGGSDVGGPKTTEKDGGKDGPPDAAEGFNVADFSGEPSEGGSIVFGVESELATLDPAGSLAQPSDVDTALAIYDHLIDYDAKGKLTPSLATKWENSDDLKTWTITVRTDIEFSDGTPFNAEAVAAQFTRFKDPATACTCAEQVAQILSVEATADDIVVFKLDKPNAFWSYTLAGTLGFIASPTATAKPDYPRNPVGTGPFVLEDYDSLVLKKNPNYWKKDEDGNQLPYLDQITIKPIPDARNRLAALQSGDVDMLQTADTGTIVDVIKDKKFKVQKVTGSSSTIVLFNTKKPPFDDVRMRRAFSYAFNRDEMNRVQYKGARREAYSPFPPDSPFYADVEVPANNVKKARSSWPRPRPTACPPASKRCASPPTRPAAFWAWSSAR
ncbi:MAG: ABC transporter substrate-binding protein [Acidimicrobiales bacterium]